MVDEIVAKMKAARGLPQTSRPAACGAFNAARKVIAVGASAGGCVALATVLGGLPADVPGVVIHMPEGFTKPFAALPGRCGAGVVAKNGERVMPGHVPLPPGRFHLSVQFTGGPSVNRNRLSVSRPRTGEYLRTRATSAM